ncbi:MAG: HlyD family efflux transporter periplasmic adaptor subunit [Pirellulales bacterium]
MRLFLNYEKGVLETEKAVEERKLDGLTAEAKQVEVEAGDNAIRKRRIVAPFDGRIEEIKVKMGEWIKPGDPVLKIVNIERLQLEGYVSRNQFLPDALHDRTVNVEIPLGRDASGKEVVFPTTAKIVFIQDEVAPGGEYLIVAEVQNTRDPHSNDWILKPGLLAELNLSAAAR